MYKAKAYAANTAKSPLASTGIQRRDPTAHDVQIEILFCGICHSDLHQARDEWSGFIVHKATGRPLDESAREVLFQPLGIAGVEWTRVKGDTDAGGGCACARATWRKSGSLSSRAVGGTTGVNPRFGLHRAVPFCKGLMLVA
jgi:hypothetical protein